MSFKYTESAFVRPTFQLWIYDSPYYLRRHAKAGRHGMHACVHGGWISEARRIFFSRQFSFLCNAWTPLIIACVNSYNGKHITPIVLYRTVRPVLISVSKEDSPQVTLLINPAVGGHYFLSGMRLPSQRQLRLINKPRECSRAADHRWKIRSPQNKKTLKT